jgi:hypothetical protein
MRFDETAYQHLVDGFYDAALEPTLWEPALVRASDAMSAIGAMYISLDIQRPACSRLVLGRLDPDLTQPISRRIAGMIRGPESTRQLGRERPMLWMDSYRRRRLCARQSMPISFGHSESFTLLAQLWSDIRNDASASPYFARLRLGQLPIAILNCCRHWRRTLGELRRSRGGSPPPRPATRPRVARWTKSIMASCWSTVAGAFCLPITQPSRSLGSATASRSQFVGCEQNRPRIPGAWRR